MRPTLCPSFKFAHFFQNIWFIFLLCLLYLNMVFSQQIHQFLRKNKKSSEPFIGCGNLVRSYSSSSLSMLPTSSNNSQEKISPEQEPIPEELLIKLGQAKDNHEFQVILTNNGLDRLNDRPIHGKNKRKRAIEINSKSFGRPHFLDNCSPENKTLPLEVPENATEMYIPSCAKVPRCSGCCPSQRLVCKPLETSLVQISVMVLQYSHKLKKIKYSGWKVFSIEQHEKCGCRCIQEKSDCGLQHDYRAEECRCVCKDILAAKKCSSLPNKYWDWTDCLCKCVKSMKCSSFLVFDEKTCSCSVSFTGSNLSNKFEANYIDSIFDGEKSTILLPERQSELNQMDKHSEIVNKRLIHSL